jgi:DnaJ like chaperone protein
MSWWGKLIGGTLGYMIGGPLGAVLGAAMGNNFDQGLKGLSGNNPQDQDRQYRIQTAFFTATFSIMGHICKADGQVSKDEINAVKQVMDHMELGPDQKKAAMALFNEGKKTDFPLDDVLVQLRNEIGHRVTLKRMFLEIQCLAAAADGKIHQNEKRLLLHVCDVIRFDSYQLESILASVASGFHYQQSRNSVEDSYKVLGVKPSDNEAEVKKSYRRLMSQHHPDKLVSKGLPEEMIKLATERTHEIRKAYETIKENRGW